ncbi:MAG: winged helix-turn-helix domain-containing protein [Chloroflexota bacterium]
MQITIGQILTQDGQRIIVPVFAYDKMGIEHQYLVSCGCRTAVLDEDKQCEEAIPQRVHIHAIGGRRLAETVHYAAIAYPFRGERLEETISLKLYFQFNTTERMITLIEQLYWDNLSRWYQQGRTIKAEMSLPQFYSRWLALPPTLLADRAHWQSQIATICEKALAISVTSISYSDQNLAFKQPDKDPELQEKSLVYYPNLANFLTESRLAGSGNVQWGIVHGNITAETVLVDPANQTWLIDFAHVGRAPLLCDFVMLETAVKLTLFNSLDFDMKHVVERRFANVASLKDKISREWLSVEAHQLVELIEKIRKLADELAGCSLQSYLGGLFFCAVCEIHRFETGTRHTRRAFMPFVSALMSASVIANVLLVYEGREVAIEQIQERLWLDVDNYDVRVEGQKIEVTPQEFELLKYLYENADRVCSREEVHTFVFSGEIETKYDPVVDDGRLNSAISRLRQKLEKVSNHEFITTVRGRGYKLILS